MVKIKISKEQWTHIKEKYDLDSPAYCVYPSFIKENYRQTDELDGMFFEGWATFDEIAEFVDYLRGLRPEK